MTRRTTTRIVSARIFGAVCVCSGLLSATDAWAEPVSFRSEIAPILRDNCLACHGAKRAESGYRVDSYERVMAEGDSGSAGFLAKSLEDSESFRRMTSEDESERMPAERDQPMPREQIALFKRWIEEGAKFDGDDPKAGLTSVIPAPTHPAAPEQYPGVLPITAVAFAKDGSELFAGGYHELTVWNPADGKLTRRIGNVGQRTYAMDMNSDGSLLAVACGAPGKHGEVRLFDPASGELKKALGMSADVMFDVAFSPDGKQLACSSAESVVQIYEVESGKLVRLITSHSDWVHDVAWSGDGALLATASRDKTAKVFDTKTGELKVTYSGHKNQVTGVAFHPNNAEVYSSGGDNRLHRWKVADGKKAAETAFGGMVFKPSKAENILMAASADKTVRQLDATAHKEVRQFTGHTDWAISAAFHAGTKRVAAGGFDGRIIVWNLEDGASLANFIAAPGRPPATQ